MGDWAEDTLIAAINEALPDARAVRYGDADRIAAGDEGFRKFYVERTEEVRQYGKRPDLLLFNRGDCEPADLSDRRFDEVDAIVQRSVAAIEVRSSKFEADTYIAVRKKESEQGKKSIRLTPSFTVKVEDLRIVYRWMERQDVPQAYCQVFFDSAYAINFADIFRTIASNEGFSIETPAKSQLKSTIMIPITAGIRLGELTTAPQFEAQERVTRLGRHDAYVVPTGGALRIDGNKLLELLGATLRT